MPGHDVDAPDRLGSLKTVVQLVLFGAIIAYFASWAIVHHDVELALRAWPWSSGDPHVVPAFLPLAIALGTGWLSMWIVERLEALRQRAQLRRARRRIAALEAEVTRLRNLPLEEDLGAPPSPETLGSSTD